MKWYQKLACPHCGACLNHYMEATVCPRCERDVNSPVNPGSSPQSFLADPAVYDLLRLMLALMCGFGSFILMFLVGETGQWLSLIPGGRLVEPGLFAASVGGYFLLIQYHLSRAEPRPLRVDWPVIVALNLTPLYMLFRVLANGHRIGPSALMLGIVALALICSCVGAVLGLRSARVRTTRSVLK